MSRSIPLSRKLLLGALVPVVAMLAIGCSSSKKGASNVTTPPTVSGTSATTNSTSATTAAATTGALSGSWSGSYSGSFSGTFSLTWTESGSNLAGTIKISGFGDVPTNIDGQVQGNAIHFGTVNGQAVQYTGTVSGNSMSGSWTLGNNGGSGSWNASKS